MASEDDDNIERVLSQVGATLRGRPSVKGDVMRQVMEGDARVGGRQQQTRRRFVLGGLAGLAAAAAVVVVIWQFPGGDGGAREAYAAALQQVERARTFACRQVSREIDENGEAEIHEMRMMFKEPDKERIEYGEGFGKDGEVMVTDYGQRRRLVLFTASRTGQVQDTSSMYDMDGTSGKLKAAQLRTATRDQILKMAGQAVTQTGIERVNGRDARVLRSEGTETVKTVWVDRETGRPVRVRIEPRGHKGSSFTYYDVRIDEEMDDALFDTTPPAGYAMSNEGRAVKPVVDHLGRMMTKMRHLEMACFMYANDHGGRWPAKIEDVIGVQGITAQSLKMMMSGPEDDGRGDAIVYVPPPAGSQPSGETVVMYEAEWSRVDGKVAVGFGDGHGEAMTAEQFVKLMK